MCILSFSSMYMQICNTKDYAFLEQSPVQDLVLACQLIPTMFMSSRREKRKIYF